MDIDFIIIFMIFNKKWYIFYYCILNYDDTRKLDLYVSFMLLKIIYLTNFD